MPVLTDEEVNTVRESCRQLGAIGRNLNQVARALNIEFRESDKLKQEAIEKLAERIDQHLDHVSELFDKTWSRWHDCHFQKTTVVQPAPDSSISEVICTNLDYAQYSCGLCCKNREA
ncbi:plasmid mobilization relaxosome protein MobC [Klebsiella pneumoniae]|uniref:plasmid mobilization relaxosome protein MobC n=1 Tax=Klebsiella pneumoniae TaxID=573 RepID=UPI000E3BE2BA|nr:plasmid mobilization relaxosome protein MobC [Klebsiella pneumoniae]